MQSQAIIDYHYHTIMVLFHHLLLPLDNTILKWPGLWTNLLTSPTLPPCHHTGTRWGLKAQHTAHWAAADKAPPRYYGTAERPETQRNTTTFAERKAAKACLGCTPAQLAAQGGIQHWQCQHHCQDASYADLATLVASAQTIDQWWLQKERAGKSWKRSIWIKNGALSSWDMRKTVIIFE